MFLANDVGMIHTQSCPNCYLCHAPGQEQYSSLTDQVAQTPGQWRIVQCPRADCGLLWLDPMPCADELAVAYNDYYTHFAADEPTRTWRYAVWTALARVYALPLRLLGIHHLRQRA